GGLDPAGRREARAEEGPAGGRRPLDRRQQKAVAAAQSEQLLFGSRAETLHADNVAALVLVERRRDYLRRASRAAVNEDARGPVEEGLLRVCRESLQHLVAATDRLCERAVAYEEVRDLHALRQRAARDASEVEDDFLRALLQKLLQARFHVPRLAVVD